MEEKDLFSRCESRPDYLNGPLLKDSLRSYQIVSQFDSDRSQGVLGSEVVVEESFVPDETRLSSQERGRPKVYRAIRRARMPRGISRRVGST